MASLETIWVRGHTGWQGQQRANTALTVFGVVFGILVLLLSMILFTDPAPAMKVLGVVPADRLSLLTLLLLPVIALIMMIVGIRSWFRAPGAHRLTLRPESLELRIPRNNAVVAWDEVVGAALEGNRVVLRTATAQPSSWAAADLASDPVLLAEVVTFYAGSPGARAEIGAGALARLRSGEF